LVTQCLTLALAFFCRRFADPPAPTRNIFLKIKSYLHPYLLRTALLFTRLTHPPPPYPPSSSPSLLLGCADSRSADSEGDLLIRTMESTPRTLRSRYPRFRTLTQIRVIRVFPAIRVDRFSRYPQFAFFRRSRLQPHRRTHPSDRDEDHVPPSYGPTDREAHYGIPEGFRTRKEGSLPTARLASVAHGNSDLMNPFSPSTRLYARACFSPHPHPLPPIINRSSRSLPQLEPRLGFFDHLDIDHPGSTTKSGVF